MKKILPILFLIIASMLSWAGDPPANDKSTQYLIGKWEIRTYGYHFKGGLINYNTFSINVFGMLLAM